MCARNVQKSRFEQMFAAHNHQTLIFRLFLIFRQVYANVDTAIEVRAVTNVSPIQDVKMASAQSHGSVIAARTGVAFYAILVSEKEISELY